MPRQKLHPRAIIKLHPSDDGAGLPDGLTFAPLDEFVPQKDQNGFAERWGIYIPETDENPESLMDSIQRSYRPEQMRRLYPDGLPEERYVKALMERKIANLEKMDMSSAKKSDYVIKITLGVWNKPNPMVTRRVRVSGGLSLAIFADKVLSPLMGWTRNYHAHLFTDYRDGSIFGPKECMAIDMMHVPKHGINYIPEAKWSVAHLLTKPGEKAGWKYDLGDDWEHILELMAIVPPESSDGKVVVIDGKGACPRENGEGMLRWARAVKKLSSGSVAEKRVLLREIYESPNYSEKLAGKPIPNTFDLNYFSADEATVAVKNALSLPGSHRLGARTYSYPTNPEGLGRSDTTPITKKEHKMKTALKSGWIMEESTTGRRDGVSANACSNCGTPHGLSLDTRCRAVYYCGRECQAEHWTTRHKKDCKRLAKLGVDVSAT